jgi:hypothetical protein
LISLRDIISINGLSLMLKIIDQCDVKSIMLFIWDFLTHTNTIFHCVTIFTIADRSFICIFTFLVWFGTFLGTWVQLTAAKICLRFIYLDLLRRSPWNTDVSRWQKKTVYFTAWCHMTNEKEHLISANKSVLFQFFPIYSISSYSI